MALHRKLLAPIATLTKAARRIVFLGKPPTNIDARLTNNLNSVNLIASQITQRMAVEAQEILRASAQMGDDMTDLIGRLPPHERSIAINQAQELLDLPVVAITEAWVKVLDMVIQSNKITIERIKKVRTKRG